MRRLIAEATMDLDGFGPINNSLGHAAGDKLLIGVTDRTLDYGLLSMAAKARCPQPVLVGCLA